MYELETKRLRAVALEADLLTLSTSPPDLDRALGLPPSGFEIPEPYVSELRDIVDATVQRMREQPEDWLWITNWQIVLKDEERIIGALQFNGEPGEDGQVQIGFLIQGLYQRQGYMTELLPAMTHWALQQPGVRAVLALVDTRNAPALKVLSAAGYRRFAQDEDSEWWGAMDKDRR